MIRSRKEHQKLKKGASRQPVKNRYLRIIWQPQRPEDETGHPQPGSGTGPWIKSNVLALIHGVGMEGENVWVIDHPNCTRVVKYSFRQL